MAKIKSNIAPSYFNDGIIKGAVIGAALFAGGIGIAAYFGAGAVATIAGYASTSLFGTFGPAAAAAAVMGSVGAVVGAIAGSVRGYSNMAEDVKHGHEVSAPTFFNRGILKGIGVAALFAIGVVTTAAAFGYGLGATLPEAPTLLTKIGAIIQGSWFPTISLTTLAAGGVLGGLSQKATMAAEYNTAKYQEAQAVVRAQEVAMGLQGPAKGPLADVAQYHNVATVQDQAVMAEKLSARAGIEGKASFADRVRADQIAADLAYAQGATKA